jgi:hypothetical protein
MVLHPRRRDGRVDAERARHLGRACGARQVLLVCKDEQRFAREPRARARGVGKARRGVREARVVRSVDDKDDRVRVAEVPGPQLAHRGAAAEVRELDAPPPIVAPVKVEPHGRHNRLRRLLTLEPVRQGRFAGTVESDQQDVDVHLPARRRPFDKVLNQMKHTYCTYSSR